MGGGEFGGALPALLFGANFNGSNELGDFGDILGVGGITGSLDGAEIGVGIGYGGLNKYTIGAIDRSLDDILVITTPTLGGGGIREGIVGVGIKSADTEKVVAINSEITGTSGGF